MSSRPVGSRAVGSAPPPFFWKVPVPEKDYMSENYRRIRQIANQGQKKRSEPLKAAFIPGVTKNEKYAHVPSRVGEFLKTKKQPPEASSGPPLQNSKRQQPRSSSVGNNATVNRRLSKSSTDLRPPSKAQQSAVQIQTNGFSNHGPANNHNSNAFPARRRRGSEESCNRAQESVYNWHFKDDIANELPAGASLNNSFSSSSIPAKYCHRVEYLPCDGICAEENFVVDEAHHPESARSASSCRTSRGCNTEETRILEDPVKNFELGRQVDSRNSFEGMVTGNGLLEQPQPASLPKSRSVFTLRSKEAGDNRTRNENDSADWFRSNSRSDQLKENELGRRLNSMKVSSTNTSQVPDNGRIKKSVSAASLKSTKQLNGVGGGGDAPHTLGSVPKYLKQRQEEWKIQEKEKKEAEMTANVPQGYVLLAEEERMEHLKTFKRNYDSLINDLNRIPIRIDTIRVREHKIQLEQQLTRLEEAMKTFSRPRVWIKVDG